jgi:hypothetical protein
VHAPALGAIAFDENTLYNGTVIQRFRRIQRQMRETGTYSLEGLDEYWPP